MTAIEKPSEAMLDRAQGCLLGQLVGDALGSLVEFKTPEQIQRKYPNGLREIADGGTWNTIAGQPTDDSEMALMLARTLVELGRYDAEAAKQAYVFWLDSDPFDCGMTIAGSLQGRLNPESQANGALMRVSPLGIFGANHALTDVAEWARQDAAITHVHPICQQANALYSMAIAYAIRHGCDAGHLYERILAWAQDIEVDAILLDTVKGASEASPADYIRLQGWVLIAFRNALWQLLRADSLEQGVIDTVMRGGDTDTNAAIAGALLGAVWGQMAIPDQWAECVLTCHPKAGEPNVSRPRPECFWPVDALELAGRLIDND